MAYRNRLTYTDELKLNIWNKYKAGESLWSIARSIDRHSSCIYGLLSRTSGIRPPDRKRASVALSLNEREEISRGIAALHSIRTIAIQLKRSPSTVSREINRNGGYHGYRAAQADENAWSRAKRPKQCKLAKNLSLNKVVEQKLRLRWSPEQVSGWLKKEFPEDESKQVSHETIYRTLYVQARGALKKELQQYLRSKRTIRRSKLSTLKGSGLGRMPNAVSISERPASVEDRAIPGHWEGDLIEGSNTTCIATLVERHSRYLVLVKLKSKRTDAVVDALIKQSRDIPQELYQSLTWDRGTEMKSHLRFTVATDIQIYFCDPQCPWQRGSNENTNRLLRQYFPKGTDLSIHSQAELNKVARLLNERPRKTLGFQTPADRFGECVASTG